MVTSGFRFIAFLLLVIPERRESIFSIVSAEILQEGLIDSFCVMCSFVNEVQVPEKGMSSSQGGLDILLTP